jgi:ssDNA-binding Zn-finger/Zn-ribbon topoisomerase 1
VDVFYCPNCAHCAAEPDSSLRAGDVCPECGEGYIGAETVPVAVVACPDCGWLRAAGTSSVRAGDICPECGEGYIAERER